jgi:hypothetical protein
LGFVLLGPTELQWAFGNSQSFVLGRRFQLMIL